MDCDKCKKEIPVGSTFCNHCGKEVSVNILPQKNQSGNKNDDSTSKNISYRKKIFIKIAPFLIISFLLMLLIVVPLFINPYIQYYQAKSSMSNGEFDKAIQAFTDLDKFKDSNEMIDEAKYLKAKYLLNNKKYETAAEMFINLVNYKDSVKLKKESTYLLAKQNLSQDNYTSAIELLEQIQDYKDSSDLLREANYREGVKQFRAYNFHEAKELFIASKDYQDSIQYLTQASLYNSFQGIWKNGLGYEKLTFKDGEVTKVLSPNSPDESTYIWPVTLIGNELHADNGTIYYLKNDKLISKDENLGYNSFTKIGDYEDIPPEKLAPQIGMSEQEVIYSKWGLPKHVNKTTTTSGVNEQWVYDHHKYIYFENGFVTAIQD